MQNREGKENITFGLHKTVVARKGRAWRPLSRKPRAPQAAEQWILHEEQKAAWDSNPAQDAYHVVVGWEVESVLIPQQPAVGVVPVCLLSVGSIVVVVKDLLQKSEAISHSPFLFPPCCGLKVKCPPWAPVFSTWSSSGGAVPEAVDCLGGGALLK